MQRNNLVVGQLYYLYPNYVIFLSSISTSLSVAHRPPDSLADLGIKPAETPSIVPFKKNSISNAINPNIVKFSMVALETKIRRPTMSWGFG